MSSFKRRVPVGTDPQTQGPPPGTRLAAQTGQLVVSSGVSSFDDVVGGGFPLGSVVLIKQDRGTSYANLLLRYFTAQGCVDKHGLVAVVCDADPAQFVRTLPRPIDGSRVDVAEDADDDGEAEGEALLSDNVAPDSELKIAWRYKPVATFSTAVKADGSGQSRSSKQVSFGATSPEGVVPTSAAIFDITKAWEDATLKIPPELLHVISAQRETFAANVELLRMRPWAGVLNRIRKAVETARAASPRAVIRIFLQGLGSPLSDLRLDSPEHITQAVRFLTALRYLARESSAVCMITMAAYAAGDRGSAGSGSSSAVKSLERCCDAVFEIESFAGSRSGANEAYAQDYHGLFIVHRLFKTDLLSHASRISEAALSSLGFKCRRKRFSIETIHLPPETETSAGRSNEEDSKPRKAGPKRHGKDLVPSHTHVHGSIDF